MGPLGLTPRFWSRPPTGPPHTNVFGDRSWGCCAAVLGASSCSFPQGSASGSGLRIHLPAERLSADTSQAGGEDVGNKELRNSRTCPGKTPPPFALIILFFSILHPHNNVSRPVSMSWISQRLQLRSSIQIFLEPDPASVPSSGRGNVIPLFLCRMCKHGLCRLGMAPPAKTPNLHAWIRLFRSSLRMRDFCSACVRSCAVGFIKFMFSWPHRNLQPQ